MLYDAWRTGGQRGSIATSCRIHFIGDDMLIRLLPNYAVKHVGANAAETVESTTV